MSTSAARTRSHREYRRAGLRMFHVRLNEVMVEELLIRENLLPAGGEHDREAVDLALAAFIERLAAWGG